MQTLTSATACSWLWTTASSTHTWRRARTSQLCSLHSTTKSSRSESLPCAPSDASAVATPPTSCRPYAKCSCRCALNNKQTNVIQVNRNNIMFLCYYFQILTELEHSGLGRNKEQAARMLGHLVSTAPRLIRPYMEPILKVCTISPYMYRHLPCYRPL